MPLIDTLKKYGFKKASDIVGKEGKRAALELLADKGIAKIMLNTVVKEMGTEAAQEALVIANAAVNGAEIKAMPTLRRIADAGISSIGVAGPLSSVQGFQVSSARKQLTQIKNFEKSFAQMSIEAKNEISHRGLAVKKLIEFLRRH